MTKYGVVLAVIALAGCGGGGYTPPHSSLIGQPLQPNPSIQDAVTFNVVQSDAMTPAANVPVYVNEQHCSATCDVTLTTNSQGVATASLTAYATYCISVHNAYPSPSTVPSTPSYITGLSNTPYLQSDECVTMGDTATTFNLAE